MADAMLPGSPVHLQRIGLLTSRAATPPSIAERQEELHQERGKNSSLQLWEVLKIEFTTPPSRPSFLSKPPWIRYLYGNNS